MVKNVVSVGMAVNERLRIRKKVLSPDQPTGKERRICIVSGTHGDELEGQYVCYELIRTIEEHRQYLKGIVEVYPALNPLGVDSITRTFPMFDLDMNRIFPGSGGATVPETVAAGVTKDIAGADMCIDIHASNIYIREIPQVRLNEATSENLMQYACMLNTDFVWVHAASTVLESTLAHSLNMIGVPTLVVEMGVGMRITPDYGRQLVDGILCLMNRLGIWNGPVIQPKEPLVSQNGEVELVRAETPGIFLPETEHWSCVEKGQRIGRIVSPINGTVDEELFAPCAGRVFTLREYPVVSCGSLIARIMGGTV